MKLFPIKGQLTDPAKLEKKGIFLNAHHWSWRSQVFFFTVLYCVSEAWH